MKRLITAAIILVIVAVLYGLFRGDRSIQIEPEVAPVELADADESAEGSSLKDVLELAAEARQGLIDQVDDYTARFIKQEADETGSLSPPTVMFMKVQTRHRGGKLGSPMRVYLKFLEPDDQQGREVLWAEDLRDGKLVVREAGLLGLVPIPPLDPNGMLAMQGQRYPISEIGQTRLLEKLIERGREDLDDPSVSVKIREAVPFGDQTSTLIQVIHSQPDGDEDDFSLAEISIDPERHLLLRYRSFGWPAEPGGKPPMLESYTFEDIQLNVGLSEDDFNPENPDYGF